MSKGNTGRKSRPRATRRRRWVLGLLVLAIVSGVAFYFYLLHREQSRQARLDAFLKLDERYECCTLDRSPLPDRCHRVLEDLVDLSRGGEVARPAARWLPSPVRLYLDQSRGADSVSQQALVLYWQCPNAQEIAAIASPAERLCSISGTWEAREDLAREAARRGTLVKALVNLRCSDDGFDAGLRRIQTDFAWLCARDACLDVLLGAPSTLHDRVREIVSAHADAVLTALAPRLGPGGDVRAAELLSDVLGRDASAIAALGRGDLDGLDLQSAVDLLELPLNPRKAFLLRMIRDRGSGPESSVAAVFLDAAEATTASVSELRDGLVALSQHQCILVEKALQRLELDSRPRANAALPALEACPDAAQSAIGDPGKFTLTRQVLEAALTGRLVNVAPLLLDRLDKSDLATLATFVRLSRRRDLQEAARPILHALGQSSAARFRLLIDALPRERRPRPRAPQSRLRQVERPEATRAPLPPSEEQPGYEPGQQDDSGGNAGVNQDLEPTPGPEASPTEEQLLIRELRKLGIPTPAPRE